MAASLSLAHLAPRHPSPVNAPLYHSIFSSSPHPVDYFPPSSLSPSFRLHSITRHICGNRTTLAWPKANNTSSAAYSEFLSQSGETEEESATKKDAKQSSNGIVKGSESDAVDTAVAVGAEAPGDELEDQASPRIKNGAAIVDVLQVLEGLLEYPSGSGQMMGAAGSVVVERVKEEAEGLRTRDGVDQQLIFELLRSVQLLEMDLQLVGSARKDSTLLERVRKAKERCQQSILLARSL